MLRIFAIFLLVVFLTAAIYAVSSLEVKNVQIENGQDCLDQAELQEQMPLYNKNILILSTDSLQGQLKAKFPCLEETKVAKKFPNSIVIEVKTRLPVAKIAGSAYQLTDNGLVVNQSTEMILPLIYLPENILLVPDQRLTDESVLFALSVAADLQKSDFTPTTIRFLSDAVAFYNAAGTVVLFTDQKSALQQVDSLQLVIATAKIDSAKITKIDLRFDKPIVEFKK